MSGWKKVRIGDICHIEKGLTGIASAEPGKYPLVVTALERKTCATYQFDCAAVCIPLVSSTGHGKKSLNYVHYQEGKFALGTILAAVIPNDKDELSAKYLHQYLQFYKDTTLVPLMKGAANVSLAVRDIAKVEIPLPPIEKQRKFAELFVTLQKDDSELQLEYEKQKYYIKQLRQSVLQEAIEGKLTADWRKDHPVVKGDPDYDAEALFQKIQEEKEKQIKEGKKKTDIEKLPAISNEEKPFVIFDGWKWVRLGEICTLFGGKRVANGYKLLEKPTEHIYIRVTDMKNGTIDDSDLKYIDNEMFEKIKRYIITFEDIYIVIVGATIGKCGLVPLKFNNMNLTENAARIKLFICSKNFLLNCFSSDLLQAQFKNKTKQVGVQKMAINRLKTSILPFPPLSEQTEIVRRVETHLAKISQMDQQIADREALTKQLMSGILKDAFEER